MMNQRKFSKLEFAMEVLVLLLNVVGLVLFGVSYTTGYYTFGEMNSPMILSFFLVGIGIGDFLHDCYGKMGRQNVDTFSHLRSDCIAGSWSNVADRRQSRGNRKLHCYRLRFRSRREEAIYYSLAASGAMLLGMIFNVVGSFCKVPQVKKEK